MPCAERGLSGDPGWDEVLGTPSFPGTKAPGLVGCQVSGALDPGVHPLPSNRETSPPKTSPIFIPRRQRRKQKPSRRR